MREYFLSPKTRPFVTRIVFGGDAASMAGFIARGIFASTAIRLVADGERPSDRRGPDDDSRLPTGIVLQVRTHAFSKHRSPIRSLHLIPVAPHLPFFTPHSHLSLSGRDSGVRSLGGRDSPALAGEILRVDRVERAIRLHHAVTQSGTVTRARRRRRRAATKAQWTSQEFITGDVEGKGIEKGHETWQTTTARPHERRPPHCLRILAWYFPRLVHHPDHRRLPAMTLARGSRRSRSRERDATRAGTSAGDHDDASSEALRQSSRMTMSPSRDATTQSHSSKSQTHKSSCENAMPISIDCKGANIALVYP
jgi:hypothetical protein